jgi:nucleoside-diphosphate-sugar epimerase
MKPRVLIVGNADFMREAVRRRLAASVDVQLSEAVPRPDDAKQIAEALASCDAVVNSMNGSAAAIQRNADALAAALDANGKPVRVVHLSSMTVYGPVEGTVDEEAPLHAGLGAYAAARVAAEEALRRAAPQATMLRLGVEYGPDCPAWTLRIARLLRQRRLGDLGAAGDGCCNLVHVDDVALAVERALATPAAAGQAFNLAMPHAPTWNDYLIRFALALRAVPVRRVGRRRMKIETKLLAPPLKIAEILATKLGAPAFATPPPISGSMAHTFSQDIRLDARRAGEVLGMAWRDLDSELRNIAAQPASQGLPNG